MGYVSMGGCPTSLALAYNVGLGASMCGLFNLVSFRSEVAWRVKLAWATVLRCRFRLDGLVVHTVSLILIS